MKRFTERLNVAFAWPVDHGRVTALILAVLFVFIGLTLPKGKVDFSLEQLYPQDSELAAIYKEHKAAYGADDNTFFVVREGDPWSRFEARPRLVTTHCVPPGERAGGVQPGMGPGPLGPKRSDRTP